MAAKWQDLPGLWEHPLQTNEKRQKKKDRQKSLMSKNRNVQNVASVAVVLMFLQQKLHTVLLNQSYVSFGTAVFQSLK